MKMRLAAGLFLALAVTCLGQVTTGTISGTVTDSTGAVLPGATVLILNEQTGIGRTVATDAAGRYLAPSLNLGNYRVTISQPGFQTEARTGIELTVGRNAIVDAQMTVGAVSQSVEVTGEAPLVETQQSSVSYLVNQATISELPLNGRDITQLIFLQPGVNVAQNSAEGNAYVGFGKKFSIGGMRGEDNAYLLDGSYLNNMNRQLPSGPSGALLGSETVKEFNVLTNSYSAQFGRALGGIFNAVSKSGTNEWHGDVYEYARNAALDVRNFFDRQQTPTDPAKPDFHRNAFGGTFGGPIKKDKAFFFFAYEGMREDKTTTNFATVPDADARRGVMPAAPDFAAGLTAAECAGVSGTISGGKCSFNVSPVSARFLQLFPLPSAQGRNNNDGTAQYIFNGDNPAQDDYGQVRVDYQLSDKDSIFARFTGSNAHKTNPESYPTFFTTQVMNTRLGTVSETRILSPRLLNTIRIHINRIDPQDRGSYPSVDSTLTSNPLTTIPAAVSPGNGVTAPEGAPKPIDRWTTNRYNFQEEMNWTVGGHALQYGGMIERLQFNMITPNRPFGEWTWTNLEDYLFGKAPNSYRGTPDGIGDTIRGFRQWFFALYLQDDWKVTSHLTLNLGLRWEPYTVPTEVNGKIANLRHLMDTAEFIGGPYWINHSKKDFGPRFGFAWSPGSGTSVRGGIGLFYVPNDPSTYRSQANRNALFPEFQFNLPAGTCIDGSSSALVFPSSAKAISCVTASNAPEAMPFDNQRSPHAMQYNLTVQRQIGQSSVVSAGYTGARGLDATAYVQTNMPFLTFDGVSYALPAGSAGTNRLNPVFTDIKYYMNATDSWYHGLLISVQRRFAKGLQAQVSYTWSKALSTADTTSKTDSSGGGSSPKYAWDMEVNKGYSGYHLANILSANYVYDLPLGQGKNGVSGHLISGWQLSGIVSAQSGQPFSVSASAPTALSNVGLTRTPNLVNTFTRDQIIRGTVGDCSPSLYASGTRLGGPDLYFNPCAFTFPVTPPNATPAGMEIGNVTKSFLIGPGLMTWDFSLTKNTKVTERSTLQFRAEFFNVLNRANFGKPASSLFNSSGTRSTTVGQITSTTTDGRKVQLGLKLSF